MLADLTYHEVAPHSSPRIYDVFLQGTFLGSIDGPSARFYQTTRPEVFTPGMLLAIYCKMEAITLEINKEAIQKMRKHATPAKP